MSHTLMNCCAVKFIGSDLGWSAVLGPFGVGQFKYFPSPGTGTLGPGVVSLGPGVVSLGPGAVSLGPGAVSLGPGAVSLGPATVSLGPGAVFCFVQASRQSL